MDVEHAVKVIPIDEQLQDNLQALVKTGWELVPGVQPVAIYHVVRIIKHDAPNTAGGIMNMAIDETKVFVVGPDGNRKN